jgi:hypothetical protein
LIADQFGRSSSFFGIPFWVYAMITLIICHSINLSTWVFVLRHCSGNFTRHVVPVN